MTEANQHPNEPTHPIPTLTPAPHLTLETYKTLYKESIENPSEFWSKMAKQHLHWHTPFTSTTTGSFQQGDIQFFQNGRLNVSYNCLDRHDPKAIAMIWEADEPGNAVKITYGELLAQVCKCANVYKKLGVNKGDVVGIYMPMVPEAVVAMLACTRIGAVHSVVFAGFSAEALADRLVDARVRVLVTADQGKRGGKVIQLKKIADEALHKCPLVQNVLVFQRTGGDVSFVEGRDLWWHEQLGQQRAVCPVEWMDAEDELFMLYTSGSTGKPKGVVHTTAGYLLGVTLTVKYIFDTHPGDVFGCAADVGWITGHSYIVYGPLSNGLTTLVFESIPTHPTPSRYWQMVDEHKITQFYTAPTAIRALRRLGEDYVKPYSLASLRVLGSVGEPINPEAWHWYNEVVGRKRCAIVDTYWQTETGSIIISPLPGAIATKPGAATVPFFGIAPVILDPATGKVIEGPNATGVLALTQPFPSIARSIYNSHARYIDTYMRPYAPYYFCGDAAFRDADSYIYIQGRVDDVLNVSGHRMSTAEVESALVLHPACAEAAVVGVPDPVTGEAIVCFCTLKSHHADIDAVAAALRTQVRTVIGPFATPKWVCVCDLPKTRSGKIMRRILRKVAAGDVRLGDGDDVLREKLGDLSTLAAPEVVGVLIERVSKFLQ